MGFSVSQAWDILGGSRSHTVQGPKTAELQDSRKATDTSHCATERFLSLIMSIIDDRSAKDHLGVCSAARAGVF